MLTYKTIFNLTVNFSTDSESLHNFHQQYFQCIYFNYLSQCYACTNSHTFYGYNQS